MKKKRNFLIIISSILGCIAICGFSVFSLFTGSKEKVQSANADGYTVLNTYTLDSSVDYTGTLNDTTVTNTFDYSYIIEYRQVNIGTNTYYQFFCTLNLQLIRGDYRLCGNNLTDYSFVFSTDYSNLSSVGSNFSFYLTGLRGVFLSSSQGRLALGINFLRDDVSIFSRSVSLATLNGLYAYNGSDPFVPDTDPKLRQITAFKNEELNILIGNGVIDIDGESAYFIGYDEGYNTGFEDGYSSGTSSGYNSGYSQGYEDGVSSQSSVIQNAYTQGYADGYEEGQSQDSTVSSIFSGILQVAMVPVNFFLSIFNFEILGINLSAFIRAIFTVVLTIIVLKTVLGKGGGSSDN